MKKLVRESIKDLLKPKDTKQALKDAAQELMLEMLSGKAVQFYNNRIYKAPYLVDQRFDEYLKLFGTGLFVSSRAIVEEGTNPLENIFPDKLIVDLGLIQYDVPPTKLEFALRELVAQVVDGKFKRGFNVKYFSPINESTIFKSKSFSKITSDIVDEILKNYYVDSIGLINQRETTKIMYNSGDEFFEKQYTKYGKGIHVTVPDESIINLKNTLRDIEIDYEMTGKSTLVIKDSSNEKEIFNRLTKTVLNKDIEFFITKKY